METQICGGVKKKGRWGVNNLSEIPLPDEIVFSSISPYLTMKEAARASLVSHGWLRYWRNLPFLNFENPIAIERLMSNEALQDFKGHCKLLRKERLDFIYWVDNVLAKHIGTMIEQLKVTFYLENNYRKKIDNWVVWALSKHVQRLELHFSEPIASFITINHNYVLDKPLLHHCFHTLKVKPVLTSLCLKSVNVSDGFVDQLFQSCGNILEKLSIEKSENLTRIRTNNDIACDGLRYLKISDCASMKTIDIHSPKLVTFVYESGFIGIRPGLDLLCIQNASSLSNVTIQVKHEDRFFVLLRSLAKYFSQLEYLNLHWWLNSESDANPVVDYFPVLAKLKHLDICVDGNINRNIAGWIPFIQACPILQKLTMELHRWLLPLRSKNMKRDKHPLLYLKTFEIIDFNGKNVDVDVAKFVLENGVALEEVIFQGTRAIYKDKTLVSLKVKLPQTVKLIRTT